MAALAAAAGLAAAACDTAPRPLPAVDRWSGVCRGVGLEATLTGDPADPRLAWLVTSDGVRRDVIWPPRYSARFSPHLEVLDESGRVVFRDGSTIGAGCVRGDHPPGLLLIAPGI